jgi:hypothetical protein
MCRRPARDEMLGRFDTGPARRTRPPVSTAKMAAFGGSAANDGVMTDGVFNLEAPTNSYSVSPDDRDERGTAGTAKTDRQTLRAQVTDWYLRRLQIAAGKTAVGGINLVLPETSQTIIVNVQMDSEDHEFALDYERKP